MTSSNFVSILRPYFEVNLLFALAWLMVLGLKRITLRTGLLTGAQALKLAQIALIAAVLLPIAASQIPRAVLLRPAVQVWSGVSQATARSYALFSPVPHAHEKSASLSEVAGWALPEGMLLVLSLFIFIGSLIAWITFVFKSRRLERALREMPRVKRIGRVFVVSSEEVQAPYSAWIRGKAYVAVPTQWIFWPEELRIALRHEIQHHRNRDTLWVYFFELCKAACFWNPAVYGWVRETAQLQEFACDEVLIGHRKISPHAYGRCLLKVAESVVGSRSPLVGTTGMAASVSGLQLKRRIEMMFQRRGRKSIAWFSLIGLGTLVVMGSVAFASRSAVQDRTIRMEQARALARAASQGSEIPIEMNDLVLAKLNQFVGTPEGRRYAKEGLVRMPQYRSMIERKISSYGFPVELLAIPLFESSFRVDLFSPSPYRAAGLWQFVPETARKYDLVVNDRVDERLDPEKSTEAAMKYYRDLFHLFQDWRLALKAYNEGERRVQKLIDQHQTRDPWELERLSSRESYLSGAIAMMILYKNPSLLD